MSKILKKTASMDIKTLRKNIATKQDQVIVLKTAQKKAERYKKENNKP